MFSSFGSLFCERFCHWTQQVLFCPSPVQPRWPWASLATQFFLETTSPLGCGADSSLAWLSPSHFSFFFPWCSRASKGIDPLSALMFSGPFNPLPSSIYHLPIMSPKSLSLSPGPEHLPPFCTHGGLSSLTYASLSSLSAAQMSYLLNSSWAWAFLSTLTVSPSSSWHRLSLDVCSALPGMPAQSCSLWFSMLQLERSS